MGLGGLADSDKTEEKMEANEWSLRAARFRQSCIDVLREVLISKDNIFFLQLIGLVIGVRG